MGEMLHTSAAFAEEYHVVRWGSKYGGVHKGWNTPRAGDVR